MAGDLADLLQGAIIEQASEVARDEALSRVQAFRRVTRPAPETALAVERFTVGSRRAVNLV